MRRRAEPKAAQAEFAADEAAADQTAVDQAAADQVAVSNLSLHELFEQQAREMLDHADLDEEQKQAILVAMACPCCSAGGMSYSVKLRPRDPDRAHRNPGKASARKR